MPQRLTNEQLWRLAYIDRWRAGRYVGYTDTDSLLYKLGLIDVKECKWYLTEEGEEVLQEGIICLAFHLQGTIHPEFMLSKFIHRIDTPGELAALLVHPLKEVRGLAKQRYKYLKHQRDIKEFVSTYPPKSFPKK